jgi:integral membrane protein
MKNPIRFLRRVGMAEAISFLVLLLIAMPLKYMANMPIGVKVVGPIHGALFVLYAAALVRAAVVAKLSIGRCFILFLASFLPFGPLFADARLQKDEEAFENRKSGSAV